MSNYMSVVHFIYLYLLILLSPLWSLTSALLWRRKFIMVQLRENYIVYLLYYVNISLFISWHIVRDKLFLKMTVGIMFLLYFICFYKIIATYKIIYFLNSFLVEGISHWNEYKGRNLNLKEFIGWEGSKFPHFWRMHLTMEILIAFYAWL